MSEKYFSVFKKVYCCILSVLGLLTNFRLRSSSSLEYDTAALYSFRFRLVIEDFLQNGGAELLPRDGVLALDCSDDIKLLGDGVEEIQQALNLLVIEAYALHLQNTRYL